MTDNSMHDIGGERPDQLLITCDKKGTIIGTATRENCHKGNGLTHLAFMSFVVDKTGRVVLTRRSPRKSLWGNFWDASVVSHVLPHETIEEATTRRGREELGIDAEFTNLGGFYYFAKYNGNCE